MGNADRRSNKQRKTRLHSLLRHSLSFCEQLTCVIVVPLVPQSGITTEGSPGDSISHRQVKVMT